MTQKAMAIPLEATTRCGVDDGLGGARRRSRCPWSNAGEGAEEGEGVQSERGGVRGGQGVSWRLQGVVAQAGSLEVAGVWPRAAGTRPRPSGARTTTTGSWALVGWLLLGLSGKAK